MLSAAYVSVKQASTYYEKDNYYTQQVGEWRGALKEQLGLGDLDHESFQSLIRGINPTTGEAIVASKENMQNQRAAIDVTLTAPKSVSVLLELAIARGDTRLAELLVSAHNQAVNKTLDHIESRYAASRVQKNGKRKNEKTGNLLFAKFQHDTSRELDPTLHTHGLIMNFTQCKDGKFRSLEAGKMLKDNRKNGLFYRSELAEILKKEGFELVITNEEKAFYELKEVDPKLIKEFSQRTSQIKKKVEELRERFPNMSETQLHQKATLQSRKSKKEIDREKVRGDNLSRAKNIIDVDKLLSKFQKHKPEIERVSSQIDKKEIIEAYTQVQRDLKNTKYKTEFAAAEVVTKQFLGKAPASQIYQVIQTKQKEDKQALNTMHDVVLSSLASTKLDTSKLFANLNNLKSTPDLKIKIEEKFENAREFRTPSERDKFIASYRELTDSLTRAKLFNHRDASDLVTTAERRVEQAELERYDDVNVRPTTSDTQNVVTIEDLRRADRLHAELVARERAAQKIEKGEIER